MCLTAQGAVGEQLEALHDGSWRLRRSGCMRRTVGVPSTEVSDCFGETLNSGQTRGAIDT